MLQAKGAVTLKEAWGPREEKPGSLGPGAAWKRCS